MTFWDTGALGLDLDAAFALAFGLVAFAFLALPFAFALGFGGIAALWAATRSLCLWGLTGACFPSTQAANADDGKAAVLSAS